MIQTLSPALLALLLAALLAAGQAVGAENVDPAPTQHGDPRSHENAYVHALVRHRDNVDFIFRDRILSPLTEADRLTFTGLNYFPPAPAYARPATFHPAADRSTFAMPTFDRRTLTYRHYGTFHLELGGERVRLKAFERTDGERAVLLVPFRDPTNRSETYAGGRYLEIGLPLPERLEVDFKRAANPLCAYDPSYACPIPPPENTLQQPIRAGELRYR
ncbi:MAG: DUF1684 domain-containing protein [Pseudomonadota bacterium]